MLRSKLDMSHRFAVLLVVASMGLVLAACAQTGGQHADQAPMGGSVPVAPMNPASSDGALDAPGEQTTHYIEFRARPGYMPYGHTYMVHGRLNEAGQPVDENIVGLLPSAGFAGLVVGTVVDVHGTIGASMLDEVMPVLNAYRQPLTDAQYSRLLAVIEQTKEDVPDWGLLTYNCNRFANRLASSVGMSVPANTEILPVLYVEALREANWSPRSSGNDNGFAGRTLRDGPDADN